jgi:hypothetical protein
LPSRLVRTRDPLPAWSAWATSALVAAQDHRLQWDGGKLFQGCHLAVVQLGGEHHPSHGRGRQDGHGDGFIGPSVDGDDARGLVLHLHGRQDACGRVRLDRAADGADRAFCVEDHRHVGAQSRLKVGDGGPDGGVVAGGEGFSEAEVPRQELGAVAQLAGAQVPDALEHRAGGLQLAAHDILGVRGDGGIDRQGAQAEGQSEQACVEDGQLGLQAREHQ